MNYRRDDFLLEFEVLGFSFDDREVFDKDDNFIFMGLVVFLWKDVKNYGKVR